MVAASKSGPRGEHLAALISHSDQMMNAYLAMAGRRPVTVLLALPLLRNHLLELADEIDACVGEIPDCYGREANRAGAGAEIDLRHASRKRFLKRY